MKKKKKGEIYLKFYNLVLEISYKLNILQNIASSLQIKNRVLNSNWLKELKYKGLLKKRFAHLYLASVLFN